jgi:hypothetical protein
MQTETEFIPRDGGQPRGKDWDAFLSRQQEVLESRARDGWEFVTAVGILTAEAMREASKTAGILLYFRRT